MVVIYIDTVNSSALLEYFKSNSDLDRYDEAKSAIDFFVKEIIECYKGSMWSHQGDAIIASGFNNVDSAVSAAINIQTGLIEVNNKFSCVFPFLFRIGVELGELPDTPDDDKSKAGSIDLNRAGHLEKACPPGRVMISGGVYDKMQYQRHSFRPGSTIKSGADTIFTYVSIERCLVPFELHFCSNLSHVQRRSYPLVVVQDSKLIFDRNVTLNGVCDTIKKSVIVLGETRHEDENSLSPVYHPAPTSDAAAALEILASAAATEMIKACIDEWIDTQDYVYKNNAVVFGSPVVNLYAHAINEVMSRSEVRHSSAGFVTDNSGVIRIKINQNGKDEYFPKKLSHAGGKSHYGLVIICKSPFNQKDHQILWVAGISGIATYAASRFIRDMIIDPNATLRKKRDKDCPNVEMPNIAIISPDTGRSSRVLEYEKNGWRVDDYKIVSLYSVD